MRVKIIRNTEWENAGVTYVTRGGAHCNQWAKTYMIVWLNSVKGGQTFTSLCWIPNDKIRCHVPMILVPKHINSQTSHKKYEKQRIRQTYQTFRTFFKRDGTIMWEVWGGITQRDTYCDINHVQKWRRPRPTYLWMFLDGQILIARDEPTCVYLLSWQGGCQRLYAHWRNYRCQGKHRNSLMILKNVRQGDGWFLFPTCYFWRRLTRIKRIQKRPHCYQRATHAENKSNSI